MSHVHTFRPQAAELTGSIQGVCPLILSYDSLRMTYVTGHLKLRGAREGGGGHVQYTVPALGW